MTRTWQVVVWISLWCFWAVVSRNNHPTLLIDGVATGLLLVAFASAIYFNWLVLVPRFWRPKRFPVYWACLILSMIVLTAVDVVVIQETYDILWGPDPRRFSFWVNFGLDLTGMAVHLLTAALALWFVRRRRRSVTA